MLYKYIYLSQIVQLLISGAQNNTLFMLALFIIFLSV